MTEENIANGVPTVDNFQRRLYEECVIANWDPEQRNTFAEEIAHLHEELSEAFRAWRRYKDCEVREVNGKLEGVPIEFADVLIGMFYNAELYGFDLFAAVERKHQFNLARNYVAEGRQLHAPADASPVAPDDDKAPPLCPVHQRLEDADALECEIGNDCVACSLNERRELLALIAPFAAEGNTEGSVTVLSRVVEFYKAHVGDNRVIVSYPAPAAASTVAPAEQSERSLMLEARRILMLLHDPSTHGPNYAAVENEIATALRSSICAAYEDAAVIAENCSQDEAARDEPFRIAQTIREQVRRLFATRVAPAPSAAIQNETDDLVDEVQHRMDQVVEAAVEWHQAGREGTEWFEAAEKLGAAIDSLLELRDDPKEKP